MNQADDTDDTPPVVDSLGFWAVLEIMGHKRYAGFVTEVVIAGRGFIRIDVPAIPSSSRRPPIAAYSKVFGTQALYGITPTEESVARAMAGALREAPIDPTLVTMARLSGAQQRPVLEGRVEGADDGGLWDEPPPTEGDSDGDGDMDQRTPWEEPA